MPDPRTTASTADAAPVQPFVLFTLAIIAGSGAANLYYSQPLFGLLRGIFGPLAPTLVATATLLGYGLGILLLVPVSVSGASGWLLRFCASSVMDRVPWSG